MSGEVALFGGTFDPVHLGHLVVGEEVADALGLEEIRFVPAGAPPHKPADPVTPARHRLAMLDLAIDGNRRFAVSRVDVERSGPHYTVDMLRLVRDASSPATRLRFLIGADSLVDLPNWRRPQEIIRLAELVVVGRPGYEPDLAALTRKIPGLDERLAFVEAPLIGISGTDIRRRVASGRTIRYHVPRSVEAYIAQHGLYRVG